MQEHSKKNTGIIEFSAGLRHHTDGSRQPYFTYCKKRDPHRRVFFWLWSGYDHFFQRNITMTVKHSEDYSIRRTYVRRIPAMALNFRYNIRPECPELGSL